MVDKITTPGVTTPMVTETPGDTPSISEMTKRLLTILSEQQTGGTGDAGTVEDKPVLPPPSSDALDVANMLASIKSKINEAMTGIAKENIEKNRDEQLQKFQERIKEIEKAAKAMEKAKKWGALGKIIGWATPIIMVAVGAVLVATGIGAPLGAALIAGGLVGLAAQTLQETGAAEWIQEHVLAPAFEAMGMSKEAAQTAAAITYQVVVAAIMIAASCGAGAVAAANLASAAVRTTAQMAVNAIPALLGMAQAGVGLARAAKEKDAADHEANAAEINAMLKKLQQKLEEQEDQLKEIIDSWQRGMDIVMNIIDTQASMAKMAMQV